MQKTAMIFGAILFAMGIAFYLVAEPARRSLTALLPSVLGLIIAVCGVLAQNEVRRKMAMHIAAGVALFGVLGTSMRFLPATVNVLNGSKPASLAWTAQLLTVLLCGVFLALCVRSFSAARRNTTS